MSYVHSGRVLFQKQRVLCAEHAQTKSAPKPLQNTLHGKPALVVITGFVRWISVDNINNRTIYLHKPNIATALAVNIRMHTRALLRLMERTMNLLCH